jgi:hypothetical protein
MERSDERSIERSDERSDEKVLWKSLMERPGRKRSGWKGLMERSYEGLLKGPMERYDMERSDGGLDGKV